MLKILVYLNLCVSIKSILLLSTKLCNLALVGEEGMPVLSERPNNFILHHRFRKTKIFSVKL